MNRAYLIDVSVIVGRITVTNALFE